MSVVSCFPIIGSSSVSYSAAIYWNLVLVQCDDFRAIDDILVDTITIQWTAAGVQGEAGVAGEEGEEEREEEGAGEVEGRGDGRAFLFFREVSGNVAVPELRV